MVLGRWKDVSNANNYSVRFSKIPMPFSTILHQGDLRKCGDKTLK
jgi:hypothetical protein